MSLRRTFIMTVFYFGVGIHSFLANTAPDIPSTSPESEEKALSLARSPRPSFTSFGTCATFSQHLLDEALDPNPFHTLPDELVVQIFSHLSQPNDLAAVAQCDRRFNRLISDGHVLRSLELSNSHKQLARLALESPLYALHTLSVSKTMCWLDLFTQPETAPGALKNVTLTSALVPEPLEEDENPLAPEDFPPAPVEPIVNHIIPWVMMPQHNPADDRMIKALEYLLKGTPHHPSNLKNLALNLNGKAFKNRALMQTISQSLVTHTSLDWLLIQANGIQDDDLEILFQGLMQNKTVTHLSLMENKIQLEQCPSFVKALHSHRALSHLCLAENNILDTSLLAQGLSQSTSLLHLDLDHNHIDDEGLITLAWGLQQNKTLIHLDLSDNHIGISGLRALTQALTTHISLDTLILNQNNLGYSCAEVLAQFLASSGGPFLSYLSLSQNNLGPKGGCFLGKSLRTNSCLTYLDLNENNLTAKGVHTLAESLKKNSSLTHLSLASNNIGQKGIRIISQALKQNQSLQYLNLERNTLGKKGAQYLGAALAVNHSLIHLDLQRMSINDKAVENILQGLKSNKGLQKLCLSFNNIASPSWAVWEDCLNQNTTLRELDLRGNPLPTSFEAHLTSFEKNHPVLRIKR